MFAVLTYSFNAIAPIIILILIGCLVRRLGILDDAALKKINKFNFRFPFCALMFTNMYAMDLSEGIPWKLGLILLAVLLVLTVLGWIVSGRLTEKRDRRGILIQAMFRSNYAIIGLPLAEFLGGSEAVAVTTIFQLPAVMYFNMAGVICLSLYSSSREPVHFRKTLAEIVKNPLIQGLAAGAAVLVIRRLIPAGPDGQPVFSLQHTLPWLYQAISWLARIATPLALIVLGAQLKLSEAAGFRKELISAVIMRLAAAPLIGFTLIFLADAAGLVRVGPPETAMLIAALASPLSVSSVVMAAEMHADDRLAGQVVVWTSVLGMISLFLLIFILRSAGRL